MLSTPVPTTPACTWWNRPEEDNSSGKLESTHPSRTSVKSDQGFFGVESVMRVNADSLLIRAAATSTSGTFNDLTTDLIMANNNNNTPVLQHMLEGSDILFYAYWLTVVHLHSTSGLLTATGSVLNFGAVESVCCFMWFSFA